MQVHTSEALLPILTATRICTSRNGAVMTSFVITHITAKESKMFSDAGFLKECLEDFAASALKKRRRGLANKSKLPGS